MDCNAVAARHTVADCKKAESSVWEQENYLDADILHPLQYRRTSNAVGMTDFGSPCIARPVVYWHWALAYNLYSAPLCHSRLRELCRHPQDQSSVFSALSSSPPPFVMLGSFGNGCVDFGPVSYRGKPWWLRDENPYVWVGHGPRLVRSKNYTPRS